MKAVCVQHQRGDELGQVSGPQEYEKECVEIKKVRNHKTCMRATSEER